MAQNPLPTSDNEREYLEWQEAFKAYLIQYGFHHEDLDAAPFQPDKDEDGATLFESEGDLDFADDEATSYESLKQLPVYREAYALTRGVVNWSDELPGAQKDSELVQFCANVMQITANVAKGHSFGLDRELLGGNIACLKRGIRAANAALDLLKEMKSRPYVSPETYLKLYENTYEVRNHVGVYIQELRERFDLGID